MSISQGLDFRAGSYDPATNKIASSLAILQNNLNEQSRIKQLQERNARLDALAAARIKREDQKYADAKRERLDSLKGIIEGANVMPITVDFVEQSRGVNPVTDEAGNVVMQDEYDPQKTLEVLKKNPNAFEEQPIKAMPLVPTDTKNEEIYKKLQEISIDPRYDTKKKREEATLDWMRNNGYQDIIEQGEYADNPFMKMGSHIASIAAAVNPFASTEETKKDFKNIDDFYAIKDPIEEIKKKADTYYRNSEKNKQIEALNNKKIEAEKQRIKKLYESLKTGKSVKTEISTKTSARDSEKVINDIGKIAQERIDRIKNRKDLGINGKAEAIKAVLGERNKEIKRYETQIQKANEAKKWAAQEKAKTLNKIRVNNAKANNDFEKQKKLMILKANTPKEKAEIAKARSIAALNKIKTKKEKKEYND